MERDCESELSKLNIEQNACIYHFGASVIHGQRSNILRLPYSITLCLYYMDESRILVCCQCRETPSKLAVLQHNNCEQSNL